MSPRGASSIAFRASAYVSTSSSGTTPDHDTRRYRPAPAIVGSAYVASSNRAKINVNPTVKPSIREEQIPGRPDSRIGKDRPYFVLAAGRRGDGEEF